MSSRLLIIGIGTLVLIGLGYYLINSYGQAKYDAGYAKANSEHSEAALTENTSESQALERISNETRNMSDDAIDSDLRTLGIMRDDADR